MKKILYFLPLVFSSCASLYIPPMVNAPLLKEKNETQLELSVSPNSIYASADYAFSEQYGIMINGNLSYGNVCDENDIFIEGEGSSSPYIDLSITGRYAHKYVEGAIGRFNLLQSEKTFLEAFVGGGYGIADENKYHNKYSQVFVQGDFGQRLRILDWGVSFRLSSAFHQFDWQDDYGKSFNENYAQFHVEPMAFCRVGGEHFKFVPKIGLSLPISTSKFSNVEENILDSDYYRTTLLHVSVGVHYSF